MCAEPLRSVQPEEVEKFWEQGFVHLPRIISESDLTFLRKQVESVMGLENLGTTPAPTEINPHARINIHDDSCYNAALWHEGMYRFSTLGPLGKISAQILRSREIFFFGDHTFLKNNETQEPTRLHDDARFFPLAGDQMAVFWIPMEQVTQHDAPMIYLAKSHRKPPGLMLGESFHSIDSLPDEIYMIETNPGDVIIHHPRVVHGSLPKKISTEKKRRLAVSIRYCGDDIRWNDHSGPLESLRMLWREGEDQAFRLRFRGLLINSAKLLAGRSVQLETAPETHPRQTSFVESALSLQNGERLDARPCSRRAFPEILLSQSDPP